MQKPVGIFPFTCFNINFPLVHKKTQWKSEKPFLGLTEEKEMCHIKKKKKMQ